MRDSRYSESRPRGRKEPAAKGWGMMLLVFGLLAGIAFLTAAGGAAWFFLGRGETAQETIQRYRPRYAEQRAKLKRIADGLPPPHAVGNDSLPANLAPRPTHDVPNKQFNTAILMAEHCADPDHSFNDAKAPHRLDLSSHEDGLLTHLLWTGDRSPLVESARRRRDAALAGRMEQTLGLRYLVVVRTLRFDPPRLVGEKTFVGGEVEVEAFLVDLESEKVLGGFRRTFQPDPQVTVTVRKGQDASDGLQSGVSSQLWVKARKEFAATLSRGTGGTFVLDRSY